MATWFPGAAFVRKAAMALRVLLDRAVGEGTGVDEHGDVRRSREWPDAHDGAILAVVAHGKVQLDQALDGRSGLVEDRHVHVPLAGLPHGGGWRANRDQDGKGRPGGHLNSAK